jgi:hypothetical protein
MQPVYERGGVVTGTFPATRFIMPRKESRQRHPNPMFWYLHPIYVSNNICHPSYFQPEYAGGCTLTMPQLTFRVPSHPASPLEAKCGSIAALCLARQVKQADLTRITKEGIFGVKYWQTTRTTRTTDQTRVLFHVEECPNAVLNSDCCPKPMIPHIFEVKTAKGLRLHHHTCQMNLRTPLHF